jgi:hypothetical protein
MATSLSFFSAASAPLRAKENLTQRLGERRGINASH